MRICSARCTCCSARRNAEAGCQPQKAARFPTSTVRSKLIIQDLEAKVSRSWLRQPGKHVVSSQQSQLDMQDVEQRRGLSQVRLGKMLKVETTRDSRSLCSSSQWATRCGEGGCAAVRAHVPSLARLNVIRAWARENDRANGINGFQLRDVRLENIRLRVLADGTF